MITLLVQRNLYSVTLNLRCLLVLKTPFQQRAKTGFLVATYAPAHTGTEHGVYVYLLAKTHFELDAVKARGPRDKGRVAKAATGITCID